MEVKPYVYKGVHPETGEFYIGSRVRNKEPWHIDLPKYRTSSRYVKPRFDDFKWSVLMEFSSPECCFDYEQHMIHEELENPLMLNRACYHGKKKRFSWIGRRHTKEFKDNLSKRVKGVPKLKESVEKQRAKVTGRQHTESAKKKVSDSLKGNQRSKGMHWYTDGVINKTAFECPEGFCLGRTVGYKPKAKKQKPPKEYNQTQFSNPLVHADNIRQANIGMRFWNNGIICVRTKHCPNGFKPGMLPRNRI